MNENETLKKLESYKQQGWTYMTDPTTWSGGSWSHEQYGYVHNGGGSYPRINEAVEALDKYMENLALIG